jgi:hypothetical protein
MPAMTAVRHARDTASAVPDADAVFGGQVFAVYPHRPQVLGVQAYPTVTSLTNAGAVRDNDGASVASRGS